MDGLALLARRMETSVALDLLIAGKGYLYQPNFSLSISEGVQMMMRTIFTSK